MAPRQQKIDVILGTRPVKETLDLRFADNVRRGLYPETYQSYDELLAELNYLHKQGLTKSQIEEAVGMKTSRDFSYAKSGGFSLNTRKMAELIPLGLIDHIKRQEAAGIFPPGTAKKYQDDVHRTWNESSKRTQQIAATTAGYWDNGHWVAAQSNESLGPTTGRNANPEPQKSFIGAGGNPVQGNIVHQKLPRANINQRGLDALGIPKNWYEDFYEFVMRDPDLNKSGKSMGSGLGRTMTDAEAMRVNSGDVTPEQLAAQVDLANQLTAQGVPAEEINPNAINPSASKQIKNPLFPEVSRTKAPDIDVSNVKISDATSGIGRVTRNPLMRGAAAVSRAIPGPIDALLPGVIGGGLALAGGATLPQAAQAFGGGVAEGLSGDLEGVPEPSVQMVNVGGELRPLNTDTNTLMDKPGYGLEQSGGQWREVKRGTGVASQQQRQAIPQAQSRPRTATAARTQGQMMPRTQPLNLANEGQYFIVNPIRSAFSSIFGKREI